MRVDADDADSLNSVDILENLCRISAQCLKAVSLQNKVSPL